MPPSNKSLGELIDYRGAPYIRAEAACKASAQPNP
jgi:hypothetical protein